MTSESSTVMRPKSIATVVVTFLSTSDASSTPADVDVIAASVVSGGISETADTNVVLPTPNPPATTNLTAVTRRRRGEWGSERPYTFNHPRQGRELQLDRVAVRGFEKAGFDQIPHQDDDDTERHPEFGSQLGDGTRFVTHVDDARRFERKVVAGFAGRLHHRLHAQ